MHNRMKSRQKLTKKSRRSSPLRRVVSRARKPKEPTLLEKIALLTDELQTLRSRLANAGDDLPTIGTHRIAGLETELERLWEMRRQEQAAALRQTALSDQEEEALAFPSGSQARGS
jgi:chromosome segregation ATPase